MKAIWHDLECGRYTADLAFWRALAGSTGGPVLDVGAGTGRIALELARAGHAVTAVDLEDELLAVLRERAGDLDVITVVADARKLDLGRRFPLCIMPMQTIQLLGGVGGRRAFMRRARAHLDPGGVLAIAIASELEPFEVRDGEPGPLPDVAETEDGRVYSSRPVAVRAGAHGHVLERRREVVTTAGELSGELDLVHLDALDAATLEREARTCGFAESERAEIQPTRDHVGSTVVLLRA